MFAVYWKSLLTNRVEEFFKYDFDLEFPRAHLAMERSFDERAAFIRRCLEVKRCW